MDEHTREEQIEENERALVPAGAGREEADKDDSTVPVKAVKHAGTRR